MMISAAHAQGPLRLHVTVAGKDSAFITGNLSYNPFVADSNAMQKALNDILLQVGALSFLQAAFDSVSCVNDSCYYRLIPGAPHKWVRLRRGNVPADVLSSAGFREEQFTNKIFNPLQFYKRAERILTYLEDNGYPFASISLDSIEADSNGISAVMNLDRNRLVFFDTILMVGDANIKRWYIEKYLGIRKGALYNESLIRKADSRLSQVPFLRVNRGTSVYFFSNKAMPVLSLGNRPASSVDGVIGFAPNSQLNNELVITGEANLKLQNILGSGKNLEVNYRSFLNSSQDLKLKFLWPYIFKTSIALDYQLDLLKFDTTFLDVRNEFAFQYRFIGTDYFKVFYSIQTTSLLTVDTVAIKNSRLLPASSDIRYDQYGAGVKLTRYDYFLNPRKGFGFEFNAGVGIKQIVRNNSISNIRFYNLNGEDYSIYDSMQLRYMQYKLNLNADYYIPLFTRMAVRLQTLAAHIEAENIFFNELYRIGGIRTLKGFDEQSLFASSYAIINTELRYLLQQNSNFILFWNGAWYRNVARTPALTDRPYGFGAGLNFETGAGIFSIYYALGKQFDNTIEFDKARIHFGFVNYF